MLEVDAPQQVMLEVKVAEVSKSLLDKLGVSISGVEHERRLHLLAARELPQRRRWRDDRRCEEQRLASTPQSTAEKRRRPGEDPGRAEHHGHQRPGGQLPRRRQDLHPGVAERRHRRHARSRSRRRSSASRCKFTPTVLGNGRINLRVRPEVSELNRDGVGIRCSGLGGTAILPSFTTRKAETTVQLMDGQSFAIGGLIKNNTIDQHQGLSLPGRTARAGCAVPQHRVPDRSLGAGVRHHAAPGEAAATRLSATDRRLRAAEPKRLSSTAGLRASAQRAPASQPRRASSGFHASTPAVAPRRSNDACTEHPAAAAACAASLRSPVAPPPRHPLGRAASATQRAQSMRSS